MSADQSKSLDDGFGHWFAGFVDGEGCFQIYSKNGQGFGGYRCSFAIACRRDEIGTLREIQRRTGLGTVRLIKASTTRKKHLNANPECRWQVLKKAECMELVRIFDVYPLRAKKRRDYVIWREAVIEHNRIYRHSSRYSTSDWSRMEELHDALREVRRYVEPTVGAGVIPECTRTQSDQLTMEAVAA